MKPVKPCKQGAVLVTRDSPVHEASKHDMTVQPLVNILSGTAECIARAWMVAVCRADLDHLPSCLADGVILSTCGLFVGLRYIKGSVYSSPNQDFDIDQYCPNRSKIFVDGGGLGFCRGGENAQAVAGHTRNCAGLGRVFRMGR
jgi:hypothetical protein